jgi:hypothetical protein
MNCSKMPPTADLRRHCDEYLTVELNASAADVFGNDLGDVDVWSEENSESPAVRCRATRSRSVSGPDDNLIDSSMKNSISTNSSRRSRSICRNFGAERDQHIVKTLYNTVPPMTPRMRQRKLGIVTAQAVPVVAQTSPKKTTSSAAAKRRQRSEILNSSLLDFSMPSCNFRSSMPSVASPETKECTIERFSQSSVDFFSSDFLDQDDGMCRSQQQRLTKDDFSDHSPRVGRTKVPAKGRSLRRRSVDALTAASNVLEGNKAEHNKPLIVSPTTRRRKESRTSSSSEGSSDGRTHAIASSRAGEKLKYVRKPTSAGNHPITDESTKSSQCKTRRRSATRTRHSTSTSTSMKDASESAHGRLSFAGDCAVLQSNHLSCQKLDYQQSPQRRSRSHSSGATYSTSTRTPLRRRLKYVKPSPADSMDANVDTFNQSFAIHSRAL